MIHPEDIASRIHYMSEIGSYLGPNIEPGEVESHPRFPVGELLARLLRGDHRPRDEPEDEEEGGEGDHRVELQHNPSEALGFRSQANPWTLIFHPSVCTNPPRSRGSYHEIFFFHTS